MANRCGSQNRVSEREGRRLDLPGTVAESADDGAALLGDWLLCEHSRIGGTTDQKIHPRIGEAWITVLTGNSFALIFKTLRGAETWLDLVPECRA